MPLALALTEYDEAYKDRQYRLPDGRRTLRAHDVRHIEVCCECGGLADDRTSIPPSKSRGWIHARCLYNRVGLSGVLKLPQMDQDRFCLSDMDPADMKTFVAQRK
jgi:hypothetical protein